MTEFRLGENYPSAVQHDIVIHVHGHLVKQTENRNVADFRRVQCKKHMNMSSDRQIITLLCEFGVAESNTDVRILTGSSEIAVMRMCSKMWLVIQHTVAWCKNLLHL